MSEPIDYLAVAKQNALYGDGLHTIAHALIAIAELLQPKPLAHDGYNPPTLRPEPI